MHTRTRSAWLWMFRTLCAAAVIYAVYLWYCPRRVISQDLLEKIVPGTNKDEVVQLIGDPSKIIDGPGHIWIYERWSSSGRVEVRFGSDYRVRGVEEKWPKPDHPN